MNPSTITVLFPLFAVVIFVWEKIPLGVASMTICIGLVVIGALDTETAFVGFIGSNATLLVTMFIVGETSFKTGMTNKIGGVVVKFTKTERTLIVTIMVIVGMMNGVLSNTGTAAVLIPVVIGVAAKSDYARSRLLMSLVFAAATDENLSPIGMPGSLTVQSTPQEMGLSFGFFEHVIMGLSILVCGIIFYATVGYKLLPSHKVVDTDGTFDDTKGFSNVSKWKQTLSLVILLLTLLAMIFENKIGIKLSIPGCIEVLALILMGVISEKDALKSADLKTIFLFGGTLSLTIALPSTGTGAGITEKVITALGAEPPPYIPTFVVFMLCCILTNLMSNMAATALTVPICLSIAQGMGADPRAVLMACVIGDPCAYTTPIGIPANMMMVGAGEYKLMDYMKAGLPLIVTTTMVSMVIFPIAFPFLPQRWKIM